MKQPQTDAQLRTKAKSTGSVSVKMRAVKTHEAKAKTAKSKATAEETKIYNKLKRANDKVKKAYDKHERKVARTKKISKLKGELSRVVNGAQY